MFRYKVYVDSNLKSATLISSKDKTARAYTKSKADKPQKSSATDLKSELAQI